MSDLKIVSPGALALIERFGLDPTTVNPGGYTAVNDNGAPVVQYDWSEGPDEDDVVQFRVSDGATVVRIEMYGSCMEALYGTLGAWLLIRGGADTAAVEEFLAEVDLTIAYLRTTDDFDCYYFEPFSSDYPYFDWSAGDDETGVTELEIGDGKEGVSVDLDMREMVEFFAAVGAWVHNHRAEVNR